MSLEAFLSQSPLVVSPGLLGARLTREDSDGTVSVELTEVEAYCGPDDPGSHAYRSKTARNSVMFGPVGHIYVYFSYGMHYCANIVAHAPDKVGAILLRAGKILEGEELVLQRRNKDILTPKIASGPANLAQALGLKGHHTGLTLSEAGITLELASAAAIHRQGGRVGVSGTGGDPDQFPWRFYTNDPSVSAYRKGRNITSAQPPGPRT